MLIEYKPRSKIYIHSAKRDHQLILADLGFSNIAQVNNEIIYSLCAKFQRELGFRVIYVRIYIFSSVTFSLAARGLLRCIFHAKHLERVTRSRFSATLYS